MCDCSSVHQAAEPRLGSNTESSSPSRGGEPEKTKQKEILRSLRKERFLLSKIARGIFARQGEREGLEHVLNYHRSSKCGYIALGEVAVSALELDFEHQVLRSPHTHTLAHQPGIHESSTFPL